ncbi:hypothetical protein CRG98_020358 [Punica granatum]|uniref:Amino acid transporter transmembrane domain-containing protein n=1 Tax=Punica granatum TaxID=22663 RepID=A0A2I0JSJ9_PUNGR|nr:hypothetical protein CRG98_020358 [Punica granatum]
MVGAGVLSLPYAMSKLGLGPVVVVLIISWIITPYTLCQMMEMHEMVPGKRFDRREVTPEVPQACMLGTLQGYQAHPVHCDLPFRPLRSLRPPKLQLDLRHLSCRYCYVSKLFDNCLDNFDTQGSLAQRGMRLQGQERCRNCVQLLKSPWRRGLCLRGAQCGPGDSSDGPSTLEKPSKGPMWRGVVVAYIVVALYYFPVALIGYWMFGNEIYAVPVFDMIEMVLVKKLHFRSSRLLRFIKRKFLCHFYNVCCNHIPFLRRSTWVLQRVRFCPDYMLRKQASALDILDICLTALIMYFLVIVP